MLEKRRAGILLPISSLPNDYGIGTFGKSAYDFIDFLSEAKQSYWQVLPLTTTSFGDSPYQSFSSIAGNPYFIDFDLLAQDGLLKESDYSIYKDDSLSINYGIIYETRFKVLRCAYDRFKSNKPIDYDKFILDNNDWLIDYAIFMSLKDDFKGASFDKWSKDYKIYNKCILDVYRENNKDNIDFYCFIQYIFFKQWKDLKEYANSKKVAIIGDIPIYVAYDSSDVWSNPSMWLLDENLNPTLVGGCPPDNYSIDGQLWGNPIYDYKKMKKDGYSFWIRRIKKSFELYDVLRIDHFRGFESFFAIPATDKTARNGKWIKGPGISLFKAINKALGKVEIIAEDLGYITEDVDRLLNKTKFPGMKVLEWAFDGNPSNRYLPSMYNENSVAYVSTHDNMPALGWYRELNDKEKTIVNNYFNTFEEDVIIDKLIDSVLLSKANTVIIQMQEYLGIAEEGRINTPSTTTNNWIWKMDKGYNTKELVFKIKTKTIESCRTND